MASETVFFSADPARPYRTYVVGSATETTAHGTRARGAFKGRIVDVESCAKYSRSQLRALTDLKNKNIVWSFAWCNLGHVLEIVSPFYDPLDRNEAPRTALHQIANGLSYLHSEDVVHGDLQPRSLVVDRERVMIRGCGAALCCNGPGAVLADDIFDFGRIAFWLWRPHLPLEACSRERLDASPMGVMIAACIDDEQERRPTVTEITVQLRACPGDFMI